jgi:hypothetical protein
MALLYRTRAASIRLKEGWGVKHSESYLRKLRSQGKGPKYVLFNGVPHYTDEFLGEYVEAGTSAPAKSGTEHRKLGHFKRPAEAGADVPANSGTEHKKLGHPRRPAGSENLTWIDTRTTP